MSHVFVILITHTYVAFTSVSGSTLTSWTILIMSTNVTTALYQGKLTLNDKTPVPNSITFCFLPLRVIFRIAP